MHVITSETGTPETDALFEALNFALIDADRRGEISPREIAAACAHAPTLAGADPRFLRGAAAVYLALMFDPVAQEYFKIIRGALAQGCRA